MEFAFPSSRFLVIHIYTHTHTWHTGTRSPTATPFPPFLQSRTRIVKLLPRARAPPPLLFSFHGTTSTVDLIRFFSPSSVALLFPSRPVFSLVLTHPHLHFFSFSFVPSGVISASNPDALRLRAEKSQISFSSLSFLFFPTKRTAAAQRGTRKP